MECLHKKCMHTLFEEQASLNPNSVAVICKNKQITYKELNEKASQLALYLNRNGVTVETFVGIFMERSIEMVIGLLGIMKAGGTYVPLDPVYPKDRLLYIINEAELTFILTDTSVEEKLPSVNIDLLRLDNDWGKIVKASKKKNVRLDITFDNLAYVIFTSGSTGKPKGVEVLHGGLSNFLNSMAKKPGFMRHDHMLALTTICFDISALEIYLPLITGGIVNIVPSEVSRDGIKLKKMLENSKATIIQATPSTYQMLLAADWKQKNPIKILCGGEPLTAKLARELLKNSSDVWNMYGPTETTIWSSICKVSSHENISIGMPIDNTQLYILDSNLKTLPNGESGELYIGGDGLARGYLNKHDLTKDRFIKNPSDNNRRIYKTGDLARCLKNGTFECLGRIDNQVKINGFRIELAEIESVLEQKKSIQKAVVVVREDSGYKNIFAFLIANKFSSELSNSNLRNVLKKFLPHYMVPTAYYYIDFFPLTLNKKIDRDKMVVMEISDILSKFRISKKTEVSRDNDSDKILKREEEENYKFRLSNSTKTNLKTDIQGIVAEILKRESQEIAIDRNLGEYGFDSIRFTLLAQKLNRKYQLSIDAEFFYQYSNIEQICSFLIIQFSEIIERYYDLLSENNEKQPSLIEETE
ncbi:MAG: amino acid adenylation domain-containing protein, partial [Desulfobacterales bacterium]|nr:amino acid adenylation domain-containing protein [Desulfobacterales bacterium]